MQISRRQWLGATAGLCVTASLAPLSSPALAAPSFSPKSIVAQAKALAAQDYVKPKLVSDRWIDSLNYDDYQSIQFRPDKSLWRENRSRFQMQMFHLGSLYKAPVDIYEVAGGHARLLPYQADRFTYGRVPVPADVNDKALGYPGFRLLYPLNRADKMDEVLVFLGASYFRSLGRGQHYGLSARGLAIDTASAKGEEFPDFRAFWVERPARSSRDIVIHALLDSPSVTGAYRFVVRPDEAVVMDVTAKLFARQDIDKLGLAPLTSMYAHGENDNRLGQDFRPEVHDSDGLLLQDGQGEWLWRPLNNPATLAVSSFTLAGCRGFGLLQRDRRFNAYQDLQAHYEARPSLWVEPKGKWGKGIVQLVEIPTDSEIHDNIVAYWVPEQPLTRGQSLDVSYRLTWGTAPAARGRPLEVISTHVGRQFSADRTKFVIDFSSPERRPVGVRAAPVPELWSSAGEISGTTLMPNVHTGGWRVAFDLTPARNQVHELRCILRDKSKAISETWMYQWRE